MKTFNGKMAVQQRVLPAYRAPFFELLAGQCTGGLALLAGRPTAGEAIPPAGALSDARCTEAHNINLFRPGHPLFMCWQPGLLPWLEEEDPDVLIVEANPRYRSTRKAIGWMHGRGKPVLGWGLGAPPLDGRFAGARERARRGLLASLDGVIAYSRRGAREYAETACFPDDRVTIAANAVSPPPGGPAPARGPLAQPLRLLFVGRLQARKRLDLLLEACASLPEEVRPELTIVGDGPDRRAIEAQAAGLYPRAKFTGALHGAALDEAFKEADLFVLPGTGGLAVQEAMSHALPVIAAEGDGTQEDLVRLENGWLVPPGDGRALKTALREAMSTTSLRQMGEESRRIVVEEINLHSMVDGFCEAAASVRLRE